MALDKATIYATYQDDGAKGAGGQDGSTFPQQSLLVFPNMPACYSFLKSLDEQPTGRKNPRITGMYSHDGDEIMLGCWPVITIPVTLPLQPEINDFIKMGILPESESVE